MKYQEYSKHYNPLKEIEVEGQVGFNGDWILGLALMVITVLVIVS